MRITGFALDHHVGVFVLCAGLAAIGGACYLSMPRESFPDVEFPFIVVTTTLEGANPTDVEESITIPIETELDGLEGLHEMRSISAEGTSMISLEFDPDVETQVALQRVRDAVDQAKGDVSSEAEESVVKEFSMTSVPVLIYQLVATGSVTPSELYALADKIEDDLSLIPEVLDVDVFGGREEEVVIEVDPERLHHFTLSLAQVQAVVEGTNRNVSAGTAESDTNRIVMRVPGAFQTPADILDLVIGRSTGGVAIYVRDVATVRYAFEDEESRSRLYDLRGGGLASSGEYAPPRNSVSLFVKKRSGANVLDLCEKVDEVMASYPIPEDVKIVKSLDNSKIVRLMVSDLENGIGTALVLVVVVILVAMGFRNSMLVAAAIPFSMFLGVIVLAATGDTLNMMTLFSLILVLGMLVDNAIVIVENIDRHHSMGLPRMRAAYVGTTEVAWPVIMSTATTVGAFLPLLFWPGIIGKFMSFLPKTVIIVLSASLFVALVINPTLAALFIKRRGGTGPVADPERTRPRYWLVRRYQVLLEFLLDRPRWTILTTVVLLVLILVAHGLHGAGTEFFPPTDPDFATCSIRPPEGTSLDESDRMAREMEGRILGAPGSGYDSPVANVKFCSVVVGLEGVGASGPSGLGEENAGPVRAQIEFVDREYRTEPTPATLTEMRRRIEGLDPEGRRIVHPLYGAEIAVLEPQDGPPAGKPLSIDVFGEDLNQMAAVIEDMKRIMEDIPGTVKPTDDAVTAQPTLEWSVDRARAGILGLDQMTVSSMLQIAVGGRKAGTEGHGDDEKDIRIRFPREYGLDTGRLENSTIPLPSGGSIPIVSVAGARLVPGPVTIKHLNQRRVLNASADVQPGIRNDADLRAAFEKQAREYPFPAGISYRFGGAAENQEEAVDFLSRAFAVAIFIILMMLVLEFNSLSVTAIVLSSVILSLMGVFLGLLVLGAPFGIIMTGIAVISLAGVAVNNAIVLLDAALQRERQGVPTREAIVTASMVRFRPVLLTAITTILGLVPMALKLNWDFRALEWQYDTSSAQWWQSMATSVSFGLLVATVLTLGVVPALYLLTSRFRKVSPSTR